MSIPEIDFIKQFCKILENSRYQLSKCNKTKVKSVQLGKPPTGPKVIRKVCVVAEVQEIIWGGSIDYMVCKPTLVFSLSLDQAEQYQLLGWFL